MKGLKALRLKNNLTQAELASKMGVAQQTVQSWETVGDNGRNPSVDTLKQLAELFGCSYAELLDGEEIEQDDPE